MGKSDEEGQEHFSGGQYLSHSAGKQWRLFLKVHKCIGHISQNALNIFSVLGWSRKKGQEPEWPHMNHQLLRLAGHSNWCMTQTYWMLWTTTNSSHMAYIHNELDFNGTIKPLKHRNNRECCPVAQGHNVIVHIVVLNCQKCNQCLKCQVSCLSL